MPLSEASCVRWQPRRFCTPRLCLEFPACSKPGHRKRKGWQCLCLKIPKGSSGVGSRMLQSAGSGLVDICNLCTQILLTENESCPAPSVLPAFAVLLLRAVTLSFPHLSSPHSHIPKPGVFTLS